MANQYVVLAGGAGTRLWPASVAEFPKQFLRIGGRSLLRRTLERIDGLGEDSPWISTHRDYVGLTASEAPECAGRILSEPDRRNTAPAIAWVLAHLQARGVGQGDVIAFLPADQHVSDDAAFRAGLSRAAAVAGTADEVVTLGIRPSFAATGYGYIEAEGDGTDLPGIAFVEKPDSETAERFVSGGRHLWNAGIFVARLEVLAEAFGRLAPGLLDVARQAASRALAADFPGADGLFRTLPEVSIDYALMEKLPSFRVVPVECGWSDVGSWETLGELLGSEGANRVEGTVRASDSTGNVVYASRPVVLVGVDDLVVVEGPAGILVARKGRSSEVKGLRP